MPKLWINDVAGGHRNTVKAVFDAFKPNNWTTIENAILPWVGLTNTPDVILAYAVANDVDLVVVPYGGASDYEAWDTLVNAGIGVIVPHFSNDAIQMLVPRRLHSAVLVGGGVTENIRSFGPALEFFAEATNLSGDSRTLTSFTGPYIAAAIAHLMNAGLNYWDARLSLRAGRLHTFENGFGKVTLPVAPNVVTEIGSPAAMLYTVNRNNLARLRWSSFRQAGFEATRIERESGELVYEGAADSFDWQIDQPNGTIRLLWKTRVNGVYSTPRLFNNNALGDVTEIQFRESYSSHFEYTGVYNGGLTTAPDKITGFNSYDAYSIFWNYSRSDEFEVQAGTSSEFVGSVSFQIDVTFWRFTAIYTNNPPLVMQPGVTYYVRVRGINAFGVGEWSDTVVMANGIITGYIVPEPPPIPLPTGTLSADLTTVGHTGGSIILSWSSTGADTATLFGFGSVPVSGNQTVTVTETTTFLLSLTNAGGTTELELQVVVLPAPPPPPPSGHITATPTVVPFPMGDVQVQWSSVNAIVAELNGEQVPLDGNDVFTVEANTTFELTLIGDGGQVTIVSSVEREEPPACANPFDAMKLSAFDIVAGTFGYCAYWNGYQCKALLSEPTQAEMLNGIDYNPRMSMMEYRTGQLPGLFEVVRDHGSAVIYINARRFVVRQISAVQDGDVYRAQIIEESL